MPEQLYRDRRERRKGPSRTCCWRERSSPDTCSTHTGDTISDTNILVEQNSESGTCFQTHLAWVSMEM